MLIGVNSVSSVIRDVSVIVVSLISIGVLANIGISVVAVGIVLVVAISMFYYYVLSSMSCYQLLRLLTRSLTSFALLA